MIQLGPVCERPSIHASTQIASCAGNAMANESFLRATSVA